MMVAKRESTDKTTRQGKVATGPDLTDGAMMAILASAETDTGKCGSIDPDARRQLVATEAYFLAERRGFAAGREVEDWVSAEVLVNSRLQPNRQMRVA